MNKFVLANFTQEFSLAFIRSFKRLKTIHLLSKVFFRSSHIIQFTRYRCSRFHVSLLILAHPFPFVNNFFHFFESFLQRGNTLCACIYYHFVVRFVKLVLRVCSHFLPSPEFVSKAAEKPKILGSKSPPAPQVCALST